MPVSLQHSHTFSLPVSATQVMIAENEGQMRDAWRVANEHDHAFLLLGAGSNVLFIEDFSGMVVFNRIMGRSVRESDDFWHLHVGGGEDWPELVSYTLQQKMFGLENLALIPGCVGSAPIQNIGAYGKEFKDVCEYVDLFNLTTGKTQRLSVDECQFGYRNSLFKQQYSSGYAIVAVGLRLNKVWRPYLEYGPLKELNSVTVTAEGVFAAICAIRKSKLPNPSETGNAGSFFKNPVVNKTVKEALLLKYPAMPYYTAPDNEFKLAAGWLIDQCGLKGYQMGGAAVHAQQALILINQNNATSQDILDLAYFVRSQVLERFSVSLESEVRFIGHQGEVDALEILT